MPKGVQNPLPHLFSGFSMRVHNPLVDLVGGVQKIGGAQFPVTPVWLSATPVSQFILSLGDSVAATKYPRKFCRKRHTSLVSYYYS